MWKDYFNAIIERYKLRTELLTCHHEWQELKTFNVYKKDTQIPTEIRVTYVCKRCGTFKQINL